jgi:arylsulfatase A-like enzyme
MCSVSRGSKEEEAMLKRIQHIISPVGKWGFFYGMVIALLESVWIIELRRLWKYPLDIFLLIIIAGILYSLGGFLIGVVLQVLLRKPFSKLNLRIGRRGKLVMALGLFFFAVVALSFHHPFPFSLSAIERSQKTTLPKTVPTSPNVLLITIDTLRPDHLSAYGYPRSTSPRIDQLAREGTLFSQAICQSTQTGPSHTSILTSQYPKTHGALFNGAVFNGSAMTLAEILQVRGYSTGAFISGYPLDSRFGLRRGFETYDDEFLLIRGLGHLLGWKLVTKKIPQKLGLSPICDFWERRAEETNRRVFQWLEKNHRTPFFLWVHYFDAHGPYNPPHPFDQLYDPFYEGRFKDYYNFDLFPDTSDLSQEEIRHIISLYDGEIRYTDEQVGFLLDKLKERKIYDKTLIILTADHGEDLNEHKIFEHGSIVYDTAVRVPLILKYPGVIPPGHIVPDQVQSIDIAPTVLDILGIPRRSDMQGKSLLPLTMGIPHSASEKAYIETHRPGAPKTKLGIRTEERKFIYTPDGKQVELYDLRQDPYEQKNIVAEESVQPIAYNFEEELLSFWGELTTDIQSPQARQELSEEVIDKLRSLGYVH